MSVITYPFYRNPPDQRAAVRGIQALLEYRGLVLNDRLTPDRYIVTGLDGISEADIRDTREQRPQQRGETPYDAFYGGKTITVTGRMEAGNAFMLEQMDQDFRSAFGSLVESPMKIRWFDIFDGFDDPQALAYYTGVEASGGVPIVSEGVVTFVDRAPGTITLLRNAEQRLYGDTRSTIKITPGSSLSGSVSIICKYVRTGTTLLSTFVGGNPSSILVKYGEDTLGTVELGFGETQNGQPIWMRTTAIGNYVKTEFWNQDPFIAPEGEVPSRSLVVDLHDAAPTTTNPVNSADGVGDKITGMAGFEISTTDSTWSIDDYRVESIFPGDVIINCRPIDKQPIIKKTQQSRSMFTRDFQVSLRASNSSLRNLVDIEESALPTKASPLLGRIYPRRYPLRYTTPVTELGARITGNIVSVATINNRGNCEGDVAMRIYGGITNPTIVNLTTGDTMQLTGEIISDDWIDIRTDSTGQRTIVGPNGISRFNMLTSESDWIDLVAWEPNDIILSGSSFDSNALLVVRGNHTFM